MSFSDDAIKAAAAAQAAAETELAEKTAEEAPVQQREEKIFHHCASLAAAVWKRAISGDTDITNIAIIRSWVRYGEVERNPWPLYKTVPHGVHIHASWSFEERRFVGEFEFRTSILEYRLEGPLKKPLLQTEIMAMERPLEELDEPPRHRRILIEIAPDPDDADSPTLLPANTLADIGLALIEERRRRKQW